MALLIFTSIGVCIIYGETDPQLHTCTYYRVCMYFTVRDTLSALEPHRNYVVHYILCALFSCWLIQCYFLCSDVICSLTDLLKKWICTIVVIEEMKTIRPRDNTLSTGDKLCIAAGF